MSNLFVDLQQSHDRMESVLRAKYVNYNVALCEWKITNGEIFFTAQITTTDREGKRGYFKVDAESFPDLFSKIADKL